MFGTELKRSLSNSWFIEEDSPSSTLTISLPSMKMQVLDQDVTS